MIIKATMDILNDYEPFPAQQQIHDCTARFRVVNHGTRFGGTRCALADGLKDFFECLNEKRGPGMKPSVYWLIICPSGMTAAQTWRELKYFFPTELATDLSNSEKTISTVNDGFIRIIDMSVTGSVAGIGLDIATVVDAGKIPNLLSVWDDIEARLNSPGRGLGGVGGRAIIESSSRDMRDKSGNIIKDFRKMYSWGDKASPNHDPDWQSFTFSSWDNPIMAEKWNGHALRKKYGNEGYATTFLAQFSGLDDNPCDPHAEIIGFLPKVKRLSRAADEFESAYENLFGRSN